MVTELQQLFFGKPPDKQPGTHAGDSKEEPNLDEFRHTEIENMENHGA